MEVSKNIQNVVNEEIRNFLNEEVEGNNGVLSFRNEILMFNQETQEMQIFFNKYESFSTDYDVDVTNARVFVNWSVGLQPSENKTGVSNFFINVDSIQGLYKLEMRDKQSDELVQEPVKKIEELPWKFEIEDETVLKVGGALFVKGLEFNFETNLCTLEFNKPE